MDNLTGLVIATGTRAHATIVEAMRAALAAAGYTLIAARSDSAEAVAVRVGDAVAGFALITDSSVVTFDHDVARGVIERLGASGALFCVRDYGYRRGRRDQRGAFVPIDGKTTWKKRPRRAGHHEDVWRCVAGLAGESAFESTLWPRACDVGTRPGTTIDVIPPRKRVVFPLRDTAARQQAARAQRDAGMILNLRPELTEQGPPDGPCETLKSWLPGPLPAHAEAVLACVRDPSLRAQAWCSLAREVWSANLVLDARTAGLLAALSPMPPPASEVERHPSNYMVERAVAWLCARVLARQAADLDDDARFAAAHMALAHGRLDVTDGVDVAALARTAVADPDRHRAARAAQLVAVVDPDALAAVERRARGDGAFARQVGVHGNVVLALRNGEAMSRLFDAVQPHVVVEGSSSDGFAHAHALWLTWYRRQARERREVDAPERIARRLELAIELAPEHAPTLNNAIVVADAIGDASTAVRARGQLRAIDRHHRALRPPATGGSRPRAGARRAGS